MARILVVEDDESLQELIQEWLIFDKYAVVACSSGAEALEHLDALAFDGIILDWNLGDMSGIDILKSLRARGMTTRVMMLTGSSTIHDRNIAENAGADSFVTKPFKLNEL